MVIFTIPAFSQNERFQMRQLACDLSQPWEIKFGPDGFLWVTEAFNYKISRIDPFTGETSLLIDLSNKKNFPNHSDTSIWPQGGLQGFAFHPDFNHNPYFYVAYVYDFDGCLPNTEGCFFKTKIVRYYYDMATQKLSNELVITETIPGSTDHNGGRLVIGPLVNNTDYLFYSVGDMGAGHLGNASRTHHGQLPDVYEGKILRFNLKPDSNAIYSDSWIPDNNPFNTENHQNAVWSLGHRNPQGLVFSPDGVLYESEHGPYSDDEINIIQGGYNYGFPLIMGYADGNYDGSKAGAGSGLPYITSEVQNKSKIELEFPYSDPIISLFAATKQEVSTFYTNDINNTPPYPNYYLQYPTSAPSGIDYYNSDAIPGWNNSLLVTNLKLASVYRLKLSDTHKTVVGDTISYFQGLGRFRDIAISDDGTKIYVSTDSIGAIKGRPGESVDPPNKGCILEFSYIKTSLVETNLIESIHITPNPASNYFELTLPTGISTANASLSNSDGKMILSRQLFSNHTHINLADIQPGVYNVHIVFNKNYFVKKLIIH